MKTVLRSPYSSLKSIITANFAGTFWQALMGLAFIPLYIKYLGIESYGLIGIFATLQSIFALLDVGLGDTLTREMARLSVLPGKEQETRDLVRTLETVYWAIAVFAGIALVATSPFIERYWIRSGQLSPTTIEQAFVIMGFVTAFQLPVSFYTGGLIGLQKQVSLNLIAVCVATLRAVGALLVLHWIPTIQAFFFWQAAIGAINFVLYARLLWYYLPQSNHRPVFRLRLIKGVWKFSAGMGGISILAVILTQLDKVVLSKMLSLEMFGYYMLASVLAMSLTRFFTPIFFSIYPRFTQLVSINDQDGLRLFYHKSCQFMAVLILPAATVTAFFAYEIILVWTHNTITAEKTHFIVSVMICGTALNGLMNPPYALQLAFAWTRLPFYVNLLSVALFIPVIIVVVAAFGAIGGALAWLILNVGYVLFWIPLIHKRILPTEKWRWYWQDGFLPAMTSIVVAGLGRLLTTESMSSNAMLVYLAVIFVVTIGITALTTPVTRTMLFSELRKIGFAVSQNEV
jgi:O-antigen/teichoic acid export membrane protein